MGLPGWHYLLCSCLFSSVHGNIPKPQNVRIHSRDFNSILLWDPPNFHEENLTYTAEYERHPTFENLCTKTNFTECNITALPIYSARRLRVRTEFDKEWSEWVYLSFNPLTDTIISPPAVAAETKNGNLYIEVSGPFGTRKGWPMVDIYGSSIYIMLIWKKDHEDQIRNVTIRQNSKILYDLDPGTTYCFKIKFQVFIEEMEKGGEWTNKSCITTNNTEVDPVLLVVIIVPVLVLFPFCCIMILPVYRRVKYTYFPSYSLPEHFKEFLGKPSFSSEFVATLPYGDDRVCEKITVVLEEQKHIVSVRQPNSAKQQFQTSQGGTTGLKEAEDCISLLTIQTGGNNLLHPEGTYKASVDNLHIVDIKTVTL